MVSKVIRRTHMYLALFLSPWFLMYGPSSFFFNHSSVLENGKSSWEVRFDRNYQIDIPEGGDLRAVRARILQDNGLRGSFGIYHPNADEFHIYRFDSWSATELVHYPKQRRLLAQDRRFRWDFVLKGMHARGGFEQETVWSHVWGVPST